MLSTHCLPSPVKVSHLTAVGYLLNSLQCDDVSEAEKVLTSYGVHFIKQTVEEGGISIDQLFFLDPDDNMIEICNCERLPMIPLPVDFPVISPKPFASSDSHPSDSAQGYTPVRRSSKGVLTARRASFNVQMPLSSRHRHSCHLE